jgi:hypothetical protein
VSMYTQSGDNYFVRLGELELIKILREVRSASPLYIWYVARTTFEYEHDGIRIGAVLGTSPHTDQRIASDLAEYTAGVGRAQIRNWRQTLTAKGLIATLRTPGGNRVLVMGSAKFVNREPVSLPEWAVPLVDDALCRRSTEPAKAAGQGMKTVPTGTKSVPTGTNFVHTNKETNLKRIRTEESRRPVGMAFESEQIKITQELAGRLAKKFPWADLELEFEKMTAYLGEHPERRPKIVGRFAFNWFARMRKPIADVETDRSLNLPLAEAPF